MDNWDSWLAVDEKEESTQKMVRWEDGNAGGKHTSHPKRSITGTNYRDFQEQ